MGPKKPRLQCRSCLTSFDRKERLENHQSKTKVKCTCCQRIFCNNHQYQQHRRSVVPPARQISDLNQIIQPPTAYGDAGAYQAFLLGKEREITDWTTRGENYEVINKMVDHKFTYKELYKWLIGIFCAQERAFKITLGFGFVLHNPLSGQFKYFYVSDNNYLFDRAYTIASRKDLETFMKKIIALDLPTNCYLAKPSSGWVLCGITNVQAKIIKLPGTLIGGGDLPSYLQTSKSISCLTTNMQTGKKYTDELCVFRCIALHQGASIKGLEIYTKSLLYEFEKFRGKEFKNGVTIFDIPLLEICFKFPINVYTLKEDKSVDTIYISPLRGTTLYLNLYEKHFSYISNLRAYSSNYKCDDCDRHFQRSDHLQQHLKKCQTGIKEVYRGGKFDASLDTVFDKLAKIGIFVPEEDRYFEYISVYDFEAMQVPDATRVHGRDMHYTHIPVTFSICSNIPGHMEPVHVQSDGSTQELVNQLVRLQLRHQEKSSQLMRDKFAWIFEKLENEEHQKLKRKFTKYCDLLPIISFNGSKYDIPLIRKYLPLALQTYDALPNFVIKKDRSYMVLATDRLKYMDLIFYLAAGTSLKKFYTAYKVTSPKGFFPYEYFSSISKLKDTRLPQRTAEMRAAVDRGERVPNDPYYSILRQKTISNENVDLCEKVFKEQGMKTFGDFVKYYNNHDVIGMVEGIEKMQKVYRDQRLDMFKDAVSLPRLTQKQIFRPLGDNYFTTFSKKHDYIYKELREGIVGGPSIVFTRMQERNVTLINGNLCKWIQGFDCNSMYLWCMGLPQCTGQYCLREKSLGFKKHSTTDKNFIL